MRVLIILWLLFFAKAGICQSYFFETSNNITLIQSEQLLKDSFAIKSYVDAHYVVKLNSIEANLPEQTVTVKMPDSGSDLSFTVDVVTSNAPNEFFVSCYHSNGSLFTVSKYDNEIFGRLYNTQNNSTYFLHSISESKAVLLKVNSSYSPPFDPCSDELNEQVSQQNNQDRFLACEDRTVRVLFLYSPLAVPVVAPRTIASFSSTIIMELNGSNVASGITPAQLTFVSAGSLVLPGFMENPCSSITLKDLRNNIIAKAMRNLFYADVVCLIIDNVASGNIPCDATGSAVNSAGAEDAYCFSQVNTAITNFKATHGIAHIFGAAHQRCSNCFNIRCDLSNTHPHGWKISSAFKTIMTDCDDNGARVARWSAPMMPFAGLSTGDSKNDNARRIRDRAAEVACFRPQPPVPVLNISGPSMVCFGMSNSYTVGQGPTYQNVIWEMRQSNSTVWFQIGTGPTVNAQALTVGANSFQLRASLSGYITALFTVQVIYCKINNGATTTKSDVVKHIIYPNPATESFQLYGSQKGDLLSLFDSKGNLILFQHAEDSENSIFLHGLEEGLYYLHIAGINESYYYKIIKI
jgi:hypothetical protein